MEDEFAAAGRPAAAPPDGRPQPFAWLGGAGAGGGGGGLLAQLDPSMAALGAWARPYCGGWYSEEGGVPDAMLGRFVVVFALWVGATTLLWALQRAAPPQQRTSATSDLFHDKDPRSDGPAPFELAGGIAGGGRVTRRARHAS